MKTVDSVENILIYIVISKQKIMKNAAQTNKLSIPWDKPDELISKYFYVYEIMNRDPRRFTFDQYIIKNILILAAELDKIRDAWGDAIVVTSWYRPSAINSEVGGAKNSYHINGSAADIAPANGEGLEFEKFLDEVAWKKRALGYGQKANLGFTHIDLRYGRIRWDY